MQAEFLLQSAFKEQIQPPSLKQQLAVDMVALAEEPLADPVAQAAVEAVTQMALVDLAP